MWSSLIVFVSFIVNFLVNAEQPYYLERCYRDDPDVNDCLRYSGNKLARHFRDGGIPELGVNEVEPIIIDEISISLGSGPDGYRAIFQDIEAYGVSNLTVTNVRSDVDSLQFQLTIEIPHIKARAQYSSSGVLLLIKASGQGEYWGEYEGVKAKVYFKAIPYEKDNDIYATIETMKMDFSVKNINMGVENIENKNSVIQAAMNLFINSNAQELLKEMKPSLKYKLTQHLQDFMENILSKIPLEQWLE